jgi:hypothetical protein
MPYGMNVAFQAARAEYALLRMCWPLDDSREFEKEKEPLRWSKGLGKQQKGCKIES